MKSVVYHLLRLLPLALLLCPLPTAAQTVTDDDVLHIDTLHIWEDDAEVTLGELGDSIGVLTGQSATGPVGRDWATWRPDPKRALWLAIVIPGAGQVYNRKYWKLPIVYGGFVGSIYAMQWNNQMYHDYSQAYLDLMDNDPTTQSYNQFMHLGAQITSTNIERYKNLFKKRKDYYRRYRDLSFFVLIGVYALSVIDAYVDASLSEFDISKDVSMRVSPAVLQDPTKRDIVKSSALGLQCSLTF